MEQLKRIENSIESILIANRLPATTIANIIEMIRVYGTINYGNGELNQLKELRNEIKSNNS